MEDGAWWITSELAWKTVPPGIDGGDFNRRVAGAAYREGQSVERANVRAFLIACRDNATHSTNETRLIGEVINVIDRGDHVKSSG
jgi:hypothetical protein